MHQIRKNRAFPNSFSEKLPEFQKAVIFAFTVTLMFIKEAFMTTEEIKLRLSNYSSQNNGSVL